MRSSPPASLVLVLAVANLAHGCVTDDDCSLLGICSVGGTCQCDPGWNGQHCAQADLADYVDGAGEGGYVNRTAASWGGRPLLVGGKWQLFATEIAGGCPLILFFNNSQVRMIEPICMWL